MGRHEVVGKFIWGGRALVCLDDERSVVFAENETYYDQKTVRGRMGTV